MDFWQSTLSSYVASLGVLATVAILGYIVKRWTQSWRAFADKVSKPTLATSQTSYLPKRGALLAVSTLICSGLGVVWLCQYFYDLVTIIPQWPTYRPVPGYLVVLVFGLPVCLLATHLLMAGLLLLADVPPSTRNRHPLTREKYFRVVNAMALICYVLLAFAYLDPFGWRATFEQWQLERFQKAVQEIRSRSHPGDDNGSPVR